MKILVLGATGMAGHTISLFLKESGHKVTAFSRKKFKYCNNIVGDIANYNLLEKIIKQNDYDAIINSVGILNKSAELYKHTAVLINSYLPHLLTHLTQNTHTKIVHLSTDCVFSGKVGSYTENSFRDGETFYDRSKALGEIDNNKDLTFRNSIIGPDLNQHGVGLFNWFMCQTGKIEGYKNVIWTGVTSLTLAKAIEKSIEINLSGIYHLVNNDKISKFNLLALFNRYMRDNSVTIVPNYNYHVDKSIVNTRKDFSFAIPSYERMVSEMRGWVENHKKLYPHYFKIGKIL